MELTTRECKSVKCDAQVLDVLIVAQRGAHRALVIDPDPVPWADGGRVRIHTVQPGVAKHLLASRLVQARQAFGAGKLYRPHSETCKGGTGRSTVRSREANG
jgi:hypothetical protein